MALPLVILAVVVAVTGLLYVRRRVGAGTRHRARGDLVARLEASVLEAPGETPPEMRRAARARAAAAGGTPAAAAASGASGAGAAVELPEAVEVLLDKVAVRADEVTGADIEAVRAAGYSEDGIFELVVSAAVGAGLGRLERGLGALEEASRAS